MSAAKPVVIFILGGPGAGKGTQCSKIVEVSSAVWCNSYVGKGKYQHFVEMSSRRFSTFKTSYVR